MSNARLNRVLRNGRLISNLKDLFFADGGWTTDPSQATVFFSLSEAMRVRRKFALNDILLVCYQPDFGWMN